MNTITKSLIGLAITGTTVAGATLASSSLFKENKKEQDEVVVDVDTSPAAGERRNADRVETLRKLFAGANEAKRRDLAEIIKGNPATVNSIFALDDSGRFKDSGFVATTISAGCGEENDSEKLRQYPDLKKGEICKL